MGFGNKTAFRPVGVKIPVGQGQPKDVREPHRVFGLMKLEMFGAEVTDGQGKVYNAMIFMAEDGSMYVDPSDKGEFMSRLTPVHDRLAPELKKAIAFKKGKSVKEETKIPTTDTVDPLE